MLQQSQTFFIDLSCCLEALALSVRLRLQQRESMQLLLPLPIHSGQRVSHFPGNSSLQQQVLLLLLLLLLLFRKEGLQPQRRVRGKESSSNCFV